jgi:outer membrane lipoprotein-sorting protein
MKSFEAYLKKKMRHNMDCMQIKEKLVQYIEGLLPDEEKAFIDNHISECAECHNELNAMMEIHDRLVFSGRQNQSADLENKIFNRIICEQNKILRKTLRLHPWLENWRSIMKSRITRLSAATAVVFAVIISISIFYKSEPTATAQDILSDAVKAASGLNSVHMKARMRTEPGDNFASIDLNNNFAPIEMWKKVDQEGKLRWRVEKPWRILVMDGETTTLLTKPIETISYASRSDVPRPLGYLDSWMGRLLDVQGLLDNELQQAKDKPDRQVRLTHKEINGKDKIILKVDMQTNISEDDYLRNKFISESDSLKVYQFDSDTKLLEDFKVYIIDKGQEVLVFEITDIEYNAEISASVFVLDIPKDVSWFTEPQTLPDNEKYSKMTPKEMAAAFFNAASKGDWDELAKFSPTSNLNQELKDLYIGLEVISLGEPFQSKGYPGWFVPYKVKLKNGETAEWNLPVRNDNKAKRYIVDGGF